MPNAMLRPARINIKALIILVVVGVTLVVGALVGHRVRNRFIASRALEKGTAALAAEDWKAASNHLFDYLSRFPQDAPMLRAYARSRLAIRPITGRNVNHAVDAYRRLLRLEPGDEEASRSLSRLYFEMRDFTESAYIARQRLRIDPDDASALMWLGRSLAMQRKYDEAREPLERLIKLEPSEVRAHALLSAIAATTGGRAGIEQARAWLDRAVEADPASAEARVRRGKFRRDTQEDIEGGRTDLETACGLPVSDPRVHLLIAEEWLAHREYALCRASLDAVDQFDDETLWKSEIDVPAFTFAKMTLLGRLALAEGSRDLGVQVADRALDELAETYRLLYLPLGVDLYIVGGAVEKARTALEEFSDAIRRQAGAGTLSPDLILADAVVAHAEGKPYAVISILADLVIVHPDMDRAWKLLWNAYEVTGQQRRSLHALESYVELKPDNATATIILAEAYRNQDWAKVAHLADKLLLRFPDHAEARMLSIEARLHNARGQLSPRQLGDLRRQLSELEQADPGNVNVRLTRAFAALVDGDAGSATEQLEKAIRDSDDPLTAAMQLAELHAQRGELDRAIEVCRAAQLRHPEVATPWLGLAELQLVVDRAGEARAMLEQAVERLAGEERVRAEYALVKYLLAHGGRAAAIDILRQLAARRPGDIRPRVALLAMSEIADDAEEAERLLSELKDIEGAHGMHWRVERARLWLRGDEWKERVSDIEETLGYCSRLDPGWAAPVLLLGHMQERLGNDITAEQTYRNALRLFPDEVDVVSRLLSLLERGGRFGEAQAILDRLPEKLTALSGHRVRVAIGRGEFESAIEELEHRVASDPNDAASRVTLARLLYERERDVNRSLALLAEAAALAPDELSVVSSTAAVLHGAGRDQEAARLLDGEVDRRRDFSALRLRGDFLETVGRLDAAEEDFRRLTTLEPARAGDGFSALGAFYMRQGRREDGMTAWESGLAGSPEHPELRRLMAAALLADASPQRRQRGRELLEALARETPDEVGTLLLQAAELMRDGAARAVEQAETLLERIVRLEPRNIEAHLRLVEIARDRGDVDEISQRLTHAAGLNPNNPDLTLAQAGFEADRNNPRIARELAHAVIRDDPKNVKARNLLARLAMRHGSPDIADSILAEALQIDPLDESAQLARANLLKMQNKRDEAIERLTAYLGTDAGARSVRTLLALAQLHREKGEFADAQRRLEEAEQLSPNNPMVHLEFLRLLAVQERHAEILSYLADHRTGSSADLAVLVTGAWTLAGSSEDHYRNEARAIFDLVIAQAPDRLDAHLGKAQLAYRMGNLEGAVRAYRRLLDIAPFHGSALNDLAWILSVDLGRHDEAVEFADRGAARFPNDPHMLDTRGVVMTRLGRYDEARVDLEHSVELSGDLPGTRASALLHLAEVLARLGDHASAGARLEEALEIHRRSPVLAAPQIEAVRALIHSP